MNWFRHSAKRIKRHLLRMGPVGAILCYHRIDDDDNSAQPKLSVSCDNFRQHLQVLAAERYEIVQVRDIADGLATGCLPHRFVAITFDDGYADNLLNAKPLLEEFGLCATVFVTSGALGNPALFKKWYAEPRQDCPRPLTHDELVLLADGGRVEIGGHTKTHPLLAHLSIAEQCSEITSCKADIESIIGRSIVSFAYPYGGHDHYTDETASAVRNAGFTSACVTHAGLVVPHIDPYRLRRHTILDCSGNEFASQLRKIFDA